MRRTLNQANTDPSACIHAADAPFSFSSALSRAFRELDLRFINREQDARASISLDGRCSIRINLNAQASPREVSAAKIQLKSDLRTGLERIAKFYNLTHKDIQELAATRYYVSKAGQRVHGSTHHFEGSFRENEFHLKLKQAQDRLIPKNPLALLTGDNPDLFSEGHDLRYGDSRLELQAGLELIRRIAAVRSVSGHLKGVEETVDKHMQQVREQQQKTDRELESTERNNRLAQHLFGPRR